jgi:hypothetical protein
MTSEQPRLEFTPEELLTGLEVMPAKYRSINVGTWGEEIEVGTASRRDVTTYVAYQMTIFVNSAWGTNLWGGFYHAFEGWTTDHFSKADAYFLEAMRRLLRRQGVYTGTAKISTASVLADLASKDREVAPEWPEEALCKETDLHEKSWVARRRDQLIRVHTPTTTRESSSRGRRDRQPLHYAPRETPPHNASRTIPTIRSASSDVQLSTDDEGDGQYTGQDEIDTIKRNRRQRSTEQSLCPLTGAGVRYRSISPRGTGELTPYPQLPPPEIPALQPDPNDPYNAFPPLEYGRDLIDPSLLRTFAALWGEDNRYQGEPYELLEDKVAHMYSICENAGIKPSQFHAVFPQILGGRARDYYFLSLARHRESFRVEYNMIKTRFDTGVQKNPYLIDWTIVTTTSR